MVAPRLHQNFNGSTAHLIASDSRVADGLESTLAKLGVTLRRVPLAEGKAQIDLASLSADRDILLIDGDLFQPIDLAGGNNGLHPCLPVVGIVGVQAPSRLKSLIQSGATALLRKPIHSSDIYQALFLAVNAFKRRQHLEWLIEDQGRRQRGRRYIVKAILRLMRTTGIDDDQAYAVLRRESMRLQMRIEDYCASVLRADQGDRDDNAVIRGARTAAGFD